jgi:hypothetical protein
MCSGSVCGALGEPVGRLRDQLGRAQKTVDMFTGVGLPK